MRILETSSKIAEEVIRERQEEEYKGKATGATNVPRCLVHQLATRRSQCFDTYDGKKPPVGVESYKDNLDNYIIGGEKLLSIYATKRDIREDRFANFQQQQNEGFRASESHSAENAFIVVDGNIQSILLLYIFCPKFNA